MVTIIIKKENKNIKEIIVSGHTQNILCAALSTLLPATINYIFLLEEDTVDYVDDNDILTIKVLIETKYNQMFLKQMLQMIKDMQEMYPQEIVIKEESK